MRCSRSIPLRRWRMGVMLLLILWLLGSLGTAPPAYAATITVTTTEGEFNEDGDCALREAITAANTDTAVDACPAGSGADTIVLADGALYTLAEVDNTADGANGLPSITSTITIAGRGATIERSSTEGTPPFRLFHVAAGGDLTLTALTARRGLTGPGTPGAGIYNAGVLTMHDSTLSQNVADSEPGGGIANVGDGRVTLHNSSIIFNAAFFSSGGGGIWNVGAGPVELFDSTIDGNLASRGAGIFNLNATLTLTRSSVSGNSISEEGAVDPGIVNFGGTLTLIDSTVSDNGGNGRIGSAGGIVNGGTLTLLRSTVRNNFGSSGGGIVNGGRATVRESTVSSNRSGDGGGIVNGGTLELVNSTVSDNRVCDDTEPECFIEEATGRGGGILNSGGLTLRNSTLSGNQAAAGGGIFNAGDATFNNVTIADNTARGTSEATALGGGGVASLRAATMSNSILAANTDTSGQAPDCAGPLTSQGYNLLQDSTGCTFDAAPGDIVGAAPLLGPLQDNGGRTATHALLPGSPAIDAGNPDPPGSGATACERTDQRGVPRPQDGDGDGSARCDIGAFEREGGITAIALRSFTAEANAGRVTLRWETASETDNAGFNLYRATSEAGPYITKLNATLIPAKGDVANGASYTYVDMAGPGTFFYKLEDVDTQGVRTLHGPVQAGGGEPAAGETVYLPFLNQ